MIQLYELWKGGIDVFTAFDATKDNTAILTQGIADPVPANADPVPGVSPSNFSYVRPIKDGFTMWNLVKNEVFYCLTIV